MSAATGDRGSAIVEFIGIGIGMLVPIVYVLLAASGVQSGVFASTQAVREAGRAFVSSATPEEAHLRATAAARMAFEDHAITLPADALTVTCLGGPCLTPGTDVIVDVRWKVALPWLPEGIAGSAPSLVPIHARHRVPVDEYRGVPA